MPDSGRTDGFSPLPLPDGRWIAADDAAGRLNLKVGSSSALNVKVERQGATLIAGLPEPASAGDFDLWPVAYWLFARHPDCQAIAWAGMATPPADGLRSGLLSPTDDGAGWQTLRTMFWQLPQPWLQTPGSAGYPQVMRMTAGRRHPVRPPKPQGIVYRRFDARLGSWISLRTLDIDSDLERFNVWQNDPRVLEFWQEGGGIAQHRTYLEKLAADPHSLTLIGCFDDEPFGYFEAYWAKEDRIAPFYAAQDYDRGIHMLVGEQAHRGPHKVSSWLPALIHYLFLDEPRTQALVSEPRSDNARMIGHMQAHGFNRDKDFDFPHKRASLLHLTRERFFDGCTLS